MRFPSQTEIALNKFPFEGGFRGMYLQRQLHARQLRLTAEATTPVGGGGIKPRGERSGTRGTFLLRDNTPEWGRRSLGSPAPAQVRFHLHHNTSINLSHLYHHP